MYRTIASHWFGHPWAIAAEAFHAIGAAVLRTVEVGAGPSKAAAKAIAAGVRPGAATVAGGGVAVLPISGVIVHRASPMDEYFGGVTSAEGVGAQIDSLIANRAVRKIVLAIDSPGGSVYGIQELASKIRGARQDKKIVAIADPVAASAALWIGSQATEFHVTPSGQVGSIGVIATHADYSQLDARIGVKVTHVTAGKYKAEGSDSAPLTDEAIAYMQSKVDAYYASFVGDVAKGRGVSEASVRSDFGQGRMLLAADAKRVGLVDGVSTMGQLLTRLGATGEQRAEVTPGDVVRATARAVEIGL